MDVSPDAACVWLGDPLGNLMAVDMRTAAHPLGHGISICDR